jgi:hypothetical protein
LRELLDVLTAHLKQLTGIDYVLMLIMAGVGALGAIAIVRRSRREQPPARTEDVSTKPWPQVRTAAWQFRKPLVWGGVLVVALLIAGAQHSDATARALFSFVASLILAALGIVASYHASALIARAELLLYGVQACRQLEALHMSMKRRQTAGSPVSSQTVGDWCDHVRAAKAAWVQQVIAITEAQKSAERRVNEIDEAYNLLLAAAPDAETRSALRTQREVAVDAVEIEAPFALHKPTAFGCPYCGARGSVRLLDSPGAVERVGCGACNRRLVIRRAETGELAVRVQGLEFLDPRALLPGLKVVAEVFARAPNQTLGSFGEYRSAVEAGLREAGLPATVVQGRLYDLLYTRLHAFRLLGPGAGIALKVKPEDLLTFVERQLAQRVEAPAVPAVLCRQLYGDDTERLPALEELLKKPT